MKNCKSCQKEIEDQAIKCPHCHEYQNAKGVSLFKLGAFFIVAMLLMIAVMITIEHLGRPAEFSSHKEDLKLESISEHNETDFIIRNYKVHNTTRYKWTDIRYTIVGSNDKGELIETKSDGNSDWTIQPNSWSYLTVPIFKNEKVTKWEVQIIDMTNPTHRTNR